MTTFTPPTEFSTARGDPYDLDPAERLMSFYDPQLAGITVWKDQQGVWHESQYPYAGRPESPGLNQAEFVFLGGHTYEVDSGVAIQLIAEGYELNTAPVNHTWFKSPNISKFTEWFLSDGTPTTEATYALNVNGAENLVITSPTNTDEFQNSSRRFFVHTDTALNTDFDATCIFDPTNYGVSGIAEQFGVVVRAQQVGGRNIGITINNNIFFVVPHVNIGVWSSNLTGGEFRNRQTSLLTGLIVPLPHHYDIALRGNIIHVRNQKEGLARPSWNSSTHAITVDLDTVGTAQQILDNPTPTGDGAAGLIAAHLGSSPLVSNRYRGLRMAPGGKLFPEVT